MLALLHEIIWYDVSIIKIESNKWGIGKVFKKSSKRGKIIIINHYGTTPDMPGATKHYDMAQFFAKKNEYDIEFWMCGYNHVTGKFADGLNGPHIQYEYIEDGVKIVKIKSVPDWGGLAMRQLNIMVFDLITGIKILFEHNIRCVILSMPPITFFSTDAMILRNIKMIADVEDLWPLFMEDMGMKNKFVSAYMTHFANRSYNAAIAIEAVSNGMLKYVRKRIKKKDKILWMSPLGVNLDLFQGDKEIKYVKKYSWKNDFVVMYAGAHGRANDLETVLKTIRRFNSRHTQVKGKKVAFVFLGNGDNKAELIKYKNMHNLGNVYFEEAVAGKIVPQLLKNADVCLTNLKKVESFKLVRPNKIFQYMAAGRPIVCGIWGEAAKIVEKSKSGIYVDFTKEEAAEELYDFISSYELEELGKNGLKYISKHGNREIIFEDFYNHLGETIG